jgi:hypothetical protein
MLALRAITIEQKILLRKKRRTVVGWKKGVKKRLTFTLPAQQAKTGQPLAPILGQVQLLVSEFVSTFNSKTVNYTAGTLLLVELFVYWDKSYVMRFLPIPFLSALHKLTFTVPTSIDFGLIRGFSNQCIYIDDLYRLFLVCRTKYFNNFLSDKSLFSTLLGHITNFGISVTLFRREDLVSLVKYLVDDEIRTLYFIMCRLHVPFSSVHKVILPSWLAAKRRLEEMRRQRSGARLNKKRYVVVTRPRR